MKKIIIVLLIVAFCFPVSGRQKLIDKKGMILKKIIQLDINNHCYVYIDVKTKDEYRIFKDFVMGSIAVVRIPKGGKNAK
jgi:hypothetical protein